MKQSGKCDIKGCTNQVLKPTHHCYTQYGQNKKLCMNLVHNICAHNESLTYIYIYIYIIYIYIYIIYIYIYIK